MFPIIFSLALAKMPERANEISGLLIMAVSGGAVIPLVMGFVSTTFGPLVSITVIGACMLYMLWVSFYVVRVNSLFAKKINLELHEKRTVQKILNDISSVKIAVDW